jgi:hypothetical protein
MTARADMVHRLAGLVGPGVLEIENAQAGWPALATLHGDGLPVSLAVFAGRVGDSHRGRDDVERRFQNPSGSRPLTSVPGRASVLVGLWEDDIRLSVPHPIVVTADAARREARTTSAGSGNLCQLDGGGPLDDLAEFGVGGVPVPPAM